VFSSVLLNECLKKDLKPHNGNQSLTRLRQERSKAIIQLSDYNLTFRAELLATLNPSRASSRKRAHCFINEYGLDFCLNTSKVNQ